MIELKSKSPTDIAAELIAGYILIDRAYERMDSNRAVREPGSILLDMRSKIVVQMAEQLGGNTAQFAMAIAERLRPEYAQ